MCVGAHHLQLLVEIPPTFTPTLSVVVLSGPSESRATVGMQIATLRSVDSKDRLTKDGKI